jgi:hypothetical protein
LVYRAFCRIDGERVADAKTLIRLAHLLDEPVLKDLLAQLVTLGRARRVIQGRRLRVDTTVVETNIHYPTDATLLADGVRVLTRGLQRLGQRVRQRARSVARRVFEIAQRSRTAGNRVAPKVREQSKARMKLLYQGLLGITRAVVRQAEAAVPRRRREPLAVQLSITIELVKRVVAQTRARVLRGDIHFPGKVVSLFEAHTEIIRKGKLAKPTEFGRLVKIQEAEAQFITDYDVCERGQSERALWEPALDRHIALFDHPPHLAVADGGFASRSNEHAAQARGVRHVVLPRQSREERSRTERVPRKPFGQQNSISGGDSMWPAARPGLSSFGPRAAISLSRVWRRRGKRRQAEHLLSPIYDSFTEGLLTPDLREARTLLEAQSQPVAAPGEDGLAYPSASWVKCAASGALVGSDSNFPGQDIPLDGSPTGNWADRPEERARAILAQPRGFITRAIATA